MRNVVIGTVQMQCSKSVRENIEKADFMVRKAAEQGANVILRRSFLKDRIFARKEDILTILMQSRFWKTMQFAILKMWQRSSG